MPVANKLFPVDAAGIGGRNMLLPGEILGFIKIPKKSAEVIVAEETSRDCEYHTPEVSQNSEGLNVKSVPNATGRFAD